VLISRVPRRVRPGILGRIAPSGSAAGRSIVRNDVIVREFRLSSFVPLPLKRGIPASHLPCNFTEVRWMGSKRYWYLFK
jgi:hypothetical protein